MATTGERALSILVARSGGSVEDGQKATGQGGILEGQDPSQYDPKNPVCPKRAHVVRREVLTSGTYRLFSSSSKHVSFSACAEHLLGPSVFGRIPGFTDTIFPEEAIPNLSNVANLGLILFLFIIGLEVDLRYFFSNWKIALSVGAVGMTVPFALGASS